MSDRVRHFLITTLFSTGDVLPFVAIGTQLIERGHRVTLVTHAPFRALAEQAGLGFATWDTPDEHRELMQDGTLFNDISGFTTIYERHIVPKLPREAAVLRDHCDEHTVVVTRSGPAIAARTVAEQRGVPLVEVVLGPGHVSPLEIVTEFARPFHAAIAELRGQTDADRATIDVWVTACNACIGLWPTWFAPPESHWPAALELAGFVDAHVAVEPLAPDVAALLDGSRRTMLLACGTGRFLSPEVVSACATAASRLDATLLVVTPFEDLVPRPRPPHVHWFRALPYSAVVPRVSLLLHHGGIGTLQEALRAGVPQIVLGAGGDRPINASYVERLGVGRYVRPAEWAPPAILRAASELLDDNARHACEQAAARLRADPPDRASQILEALPQTRFAVAFAEAAAARPAKNDALAARIAGLTPAQRAQLLARMRTRKS